MQLSELQTSSLIREAAQKPEVRKSYIEGCVREAAKLDADPTAKARRRLGALGRGGGGGRRPCVRSARSLPLHPAPFPPAALSPFLT